MKTIMAKKEEMERKWFIVDAEGKTLGRIASGIAEVLIGKHKPIFTPHVDTGDHVIVINCERVRLTGDKINQKVRYRHSGYVGNLKEIPYSKIMAERPQFAVAEAVRGMLPKNR